MIYNPWKGCHRISEGCKNCYVHGGNFKRGIDTNIIFKTNDFYKLIEKDNNNNYKIKPNTLVYLCFSSDFLIEEADIWRKEVLEMIKVRKDLSFLFLTKRINRYSKCIKEKIPNLMVGVSIENQKNATERLNILKDLDIDVKYIILQPLLELVNIEEYLDESIYEVVVGGEETKIARPLNFDWVLNIRKQCINKNVSFTFRQLSSNFIKDNILYKIPRIEIRKQAKLANIDYKRIE